MTVLRVAAGQAVSVAGDAAANVATAARLTRSAGEAGARVLLLPEAFLTGYDHDAFRGPLPGDDLGAWLDPLRQACSETDVVLVAGVALERTHGRTLSLVVVRPDGRADAPYDKQHLDPSERPFFVAGDHGASLVVDGVELGLSVCYDGSFPELARAAAADGAVAYLNSAAFFRGSEHRRDLYGRARALDNGLYVVFAGLTGRCGSFDFSGGSAIHDPEGRTLAVLGVEEGLAVADLDTEVVAATRARHTMLTDHLPGLGQRVRVG